MKQELLCTWLELPKSAWPPDPWTLLGVPRDCDQALVEERVHVCMCKLRSYQLSFPEEATEGMNRLAEAFIAVAETCAKSKPKPAPLATANSETTVIHQTKLDWRDEPPPVRTVAEEHENARPAAEEAARDVLVAKPFVPPPKSHCREIDAALVHELGQRSEEATSNVGTLEAVIERVEATRRLLHAWDKIGKLLKCPAKKVQAKENDQFNKRFEEIAQIMKTYPAFFGQPGKPGYRVVVMARLRIPLLIVRSMSDDQRGDLLFDWENGRQVLLEHRKFLRRLFESMRQRTSVGLAIHAARAFVNDSPWQTLAGVALTVLFALMLGTWLATR